jgi:hypothetical protein
VAERLRLFETKPGFHALALHETTKGQAEEWQILRIRQELVLDNTVVELGEWKWTDGLSRFWSMASVRCADGK